MTRFYIKLTLVCCVVLLATPSFGQTPGSTPSFEKQLETFQKLGFVLNEGVSLTDFDRWPEGFKWYEESPYELMYITLGQTVEQEPWTPLTNQCWNFDLEAIDGNGDYVYIMENVSRITNGELQFKELKDFVDLEAEIAWVSFICNGDPYKWKLKVDGDWADGSLFDRVQALTINYQTSGKFTFFNSGGQDFVLGYCTPEQLEQIRKETGLEILWLKAKGQIY